MKNKKILSAMHNSKFKFKRFVIATISCLLFILIVFTIPQKSEEKSDAAFNSNFKNYNVKLQILNKDKKITHKFLTAIADSYNKKSIGLMNLEYLPPNYAMLFIFENEEIVSMWMRNTKISLDMLFIDKDNKIIKIARNTTPYSLEIVSSEKKVTKVLEINGGLSEKLGIQVGQEIKQQ